MQQTFEKPLEKKSSM